MMVLTVFLLLTSPGIKPQPTILLLSLPGCQTLRCVAADSEVAGGSGFQQSPENGIPVNDHDRGWGRKPPQHRISHSYHSVCFYAHRTRLTVLN